LSDEKITMLVFIELHSLPRFFFYAVDIELGSLPQYLKAQFSSHVFL
jgi:hypothetical protein